MGALYRNVALQENVDFSHTQSLLCKTKNSFFFP